MVGDLHELSYLILSIYTASVDFSFFRDTSGPDKLLDPYCPRSKILPILKYFFESHLALEKAEQDDASGR